MDSQHFVTFRYQENQVLVENSQILGFLTDREKDFVSVVSLARSETEES